MEINGGLKMDNTITRVELSSCQPCWFNFLRKAHNFQFDFII
jgi:hypothetical protein